MTDLLTQFQALKTRWVMETPSVSCIEDMTKHPAYCEIIAMGRPVVPLILTDMERHPDWWFPALKQITGEDPLRGRPELVDDLAGMTRAWLTCAEERGLRRPVPTEPEAVRLRFEELKVRWKKETSILSSITSIVAHPAYREIIALGMPVLPYILDEMERRPGWWFDAIMEITDIDPLEHQQHRQEELAGNLDRLTKAYLEFAEERGWRAHVKE